MDFSKVADRLDGIPYTTPARGRRLYDFVLDNRSERILDLGTYHGVSACYLAAALDELGRGSVTTMDRVDALDLDPNVLDLANDLGLTDYIDPVSSQVSFTWELRELIASQGDPVFDFAFLDAGKTWEAVGFAFMLTDMLLKPGGTILFDDLEWTLEKSPTYSKLDWVRDLPEDQRTTPQIGAVFDLLVSRHPAYRTWRDEGGKWGWAHKESRRRRWLRRR